MSLTVRRLVPHSRQRSAMSALASWGLATRATNYVLVGVLVLTLARHGHAKETDQHGALEETTRHTGGTALVWVIAFGLFAYAAWRYYEAAFGVRAKSNGSDAGPRLLSLFRGVVYTVLGASAVQVATKSGESNQSGRQQQWSAQIMAHPGGRWVIGAIGVGLICFGIVQIGKGVRRSFEKKFELERMGPGSRRVVRLLGTVGCPGRGVVFLLVGVFVTVAAVQYDPKKAGGLDRVLRELRDTTAGPWLLAAVGVGLIVFGLYGYCEAVWRRT
ncbi:MAG TPA: DUF1206 domain-containing protein [Jatrophihabitantaceae bacterium]|nr:DUF1206 domain-containing protein [Jatrophihabitantaceae bacterium]